MNEWLDEIIAEGDTVFDIGANNGNNTQAYVSRGAFVVAVEPIEEHCNEIRKKFGKNVAIVQKACSSQTGQIEFMESGTLSTAVPKKWFGSKSRFAWVNPQKNTFLVGATTIDELINEFGTPSYIKIDCEGYDLEVVRGLSVPIRTVSFEHTQEFIDDTMLCIDHMMSLGDCVFEFIIGDCYAKFERYVSRDEIEAYLQKARSDMWGNVYARNRSVN